MPITENDIKLLESERMTDATDGGGRKTSRPIVDGEAGNIFPKVSRLDSVAGRANLRKIYGVVDTENLDTYAGAHAVITDAPDNDRIHVTLFSTGSDFDTRTEARDRIESYVVAGPASRMALFGRQLNGQKAVLAFQRPTEPLPEVGEVYCLSLETTAGDVVRQQYVRVTDIAHEIRVFEDDKGTFEVRVITLQIGSALRYTFEGSAPGRSIGAASDAAILRTTSIADSSNYYGITPLAADADMGDLTIQVDSVYAPLVPSTQRESAIALASPGGASGFVVSGAADYINFRGSLDRTHYFPGAVKPGTVRVIRSGVEHARDDGTGTLVSTGGTSVVNGTVDYDLGKVTTNLVYGTDYFWFHGTPAVNVSQPARTRELAITLANRGTVYSEVMSPVPSPGSLVVDYRALGKWYRLRDNGLGEIGGNDPAHGVGTVEYISGAVVVTLGALPDIGSSVLFSWGSAVDFVLRESATVTELRQALQLAHTPIVPSSLAIGWTGTDIAGNPAAQTATTNTAGVISGTGLAGTVSAETGVVNLVFTAGGPRAGTTIDLTYNSKDDVDPVGAPTVVTGTLDLSDLTPLPTLPLAPGSFRAVCPVAGTLPAYTDGTASGSAVPFTGTVTVFDDGTGLLVVGPQFVGTSDAGSFVRVEIAGGATSAVGAINHSTGAVTVTGSVPLAGEIPANEGWVLRYASSALAGEANYLYRNEGASFATVARTQSAALVDAPIELALTTPAMGAVVPGSVVFRFQSVSNGAEHYFFDRGGVLYGSFSQATGAATECGTINYATGVAKFSTGFTLSLSVSSGAVQSLLTQRGTFTASAAQFRTSGSPLRPGSLYVQATALDGSNLSAVADANGTITGTDVAGEVVQDMGVVRLTFDKDIFPSTLRYSTVVLSNLPLNADILGLDPVRLPSDGRVPIFRPADVVVIHNTQSFTLPNPATAASTYSVGRTGLSDLWLVDADGDRVLPDAWLANLAAGTVTMAADLDLTGVPQPLVARHRIEEMRQLSDVQINGTLSLSGPLTRDYGPGTLVSSALLFGDLWARVTNLFDQLAWTGVWADTRTGDGATAQYNDIDYPLEVLNSGAVTERWRLHITSGNPTSGLATFQIIGENLGVVGSANTGSDIAPVNALTGKPYFVMRAAGFGLGWAAGNQIRFNTLAAGKPIWLVRTVLPGATLAGDSFDLQLRGDVD